MTRLPLFVVRDLVTGPDSLYTAAQRLVALCLGDHMNAEAEAWPSVRTVARWTGLGETAVKAALRVLCAGPQAIFERRGGDRPGLDSTTLHPAGRGSHEERGVHVTDEGQRPDGRGSQSRP